MPGSDFLFETRAKGKLLLSGEYAVLDGALALALPLRQGQTLSVAQQPGSGRLHWKALDHTGVVWFEAEFSLPGLALLRTADADTANTLQQLLLACRQQNAGFLAQENSLEATTRIDFPRAWGLGTSSTLIAALAKWAGADAWKLLQATLGGSGYDLACAYADGPLLYRLENQNPVVTPVAYHPAFGSNLYFVYLGKKQNSREGIQRYRSLVGAGKKELIGAVTGLTEKWLHCTTLRELEHCMVQHENLIGQALDLPKVKDRYFSDYWGAVKSLGAWGGDFVLATSEAPEEETRAYFGKKEFGVVLSWEEMVFNLNK